MSLKRYSTIEMCYMLNSRNVPWRLWITRELPHSHHVHPIQRTEPNWEWPTSGWWFQLRHLSENATNLLSEGIEGVLGDWCPLRSMNPSRRDVWVCHCSQPKRKRIILLRGSYHDKSLFECVVDFNWDKYLRPTCRHMTKNTLAPMRAYSITKG